jgi:hypothetical protein
MKKVAPPKLQRFPAAKQRRLHELLDKNSEGTITAKQKAVLKRLVADAEQLMIANAKRLVEFSRSEAGHAPAGAVPVTIWVQPQRTEQ